MLYLCIVEQEVKENPELDSNEVNVICQLRFMLRDYENDQSKLFSLGKS